MAASAAQAAASPRPNILVIVLDDAGYSDLGCFGSEIRTPNIDALAQGGLRYTGFETKSLCSPTRAALLTGRNPQTVRMADLPSRLAAPDAGDQSSTKGEIPGNVQTVAAALQSRGYATYGVGKWHLSPAYEGGPDTKGPGGRLDPGGAKRSWPLQRGFDRFYGFLGGWTDHWRPSLFRDNEIISAPQGEGYHLSVDLADRAIEYMGPGSSPRPFFLYLAVGAPHSPMHAPPEFTARYLGIYEKGWDAVRQERFERMKAMGVIPADTILPPRPPQDPAWDSLDADKKAAYARFMAVYAGFLEHADAQIGRVLDHLRSTGRYDDTLVMLMSDNGAADEAGVSGGFRKPYGDKTPFAEVLAHLDELGGPGTLPLYQRPWAMAGVTPFRSYKGSPFAGGVRAPLIVSWPREIRDRGAFRRQPLDVIDLAPTMLDAAGGAFDKVVAGVSQAPVAGVSMRRSFRSASAPGREVQYFELRGHRAIRQGPWRAVATHRAGAPFEQDRWELFNLDVDFSESTDLSLVHPGRLAELQALWWREARRFSDPPLKEQGPPRPAQTPSPE